MRASLRHVAVVIGLLLVVSACSPQAVGTLDPDPATGGPAADDGPNNGRNNGRNNEPNGDTPDLPPLTDASALNSDDPPGRVAPGTLLGGGYILDTATGEVWNVDSNAWHVWAPSGHTFAVYPWRPESPGITVVDMAAGSATVVADELQVSSVAWSPDGERLAFARIRDGAGSTVDTDGVYVISRDGSGLRRVAEAAEVVALAWSADGEYLAYQQLPGDESVVGIINVATAETVLEFELGPSHARMWQWAPGGARLAWTDGAGYSVFDAVTGERSATPVDRPGEFLLWQRDGIHVFAADPSPLDFSYTLHHTTPGGHVFTHGPMHWRTPTWSPDGHRLAYHTNGCITGAFDLIVSSIDGTMVEALTTDGAVKTEPVWRPDGRAIAFGQIGKLVIVDLDGGAPQTFLEDFEMYGAPLVIDWSADGRYLIFRSDVGRGVCD